MPAQPQSVRVGTASQLPGVLGADSRRGWTLCAWISGVFTVLLGVSMVVGQFTARTLDPLKSPELKAHKEKLRLNPRDEQVKQAIRKLDLQLRQRYFLRLARNGSGVYLLLGGTALFIVAMTRRAGGAKTLPVLTQKQEQEVEGRSAAARARWALGACGVLIGSGLFLAGSNFVSRLPANTAQIDKLLGPADEPAPTSVSDVASVEELRRNWPRFRGYEGGGVALTTNAPVHWDATNGTGIAWKVPSPTLGFNSPLVWGDSIFLSGGGADLREVVCLSGKTGQVLWRQAVTNVPGSPAQLPEIPDSTGYAAASMATDGRRVYVIFANGDLAAFTLEGKLVWSKGFGALKNAYGHANSLATWRDRLLVQLDQGEAEDGKSKLYALDGRTGQIVWQKPRKLGASWASPIVIEAAGKPQVITLSLPVVTAYSAADGAELWKVECLNGEVTPSPIYAAGLVMVASPSEKLLAIRPDGQGDVSKTHVAWSSEDNVPDVTSPVSNGELVFMLTTSGMLTCLDAKDGKKQWEHEFEMECHASPAIAGSRLYIFSQKGVAVVVETARQFKELFRTDMGDAFHASPAFMQDKLVLRGVNHIWCLGANAAPARAKD